MKVLRKGNLGQYSGYGNRNMPSNGELFIDARDFSDICLVTCCGNCGEYDYISLKDIDAFARRV